MNVPVSVLDGLMYLQTKVFKGIAADFLEEATPEKDLQNKFIFDNLSVFDVTVDRSVGFFFVGIDGFSYFFRVFRVLV